MKQERETEGPEAQDSNTALLQVLLDKLPSMVAYWDSTRRCRFANRAYERWFGVTPESLIGKHISELLGPLYRLNLPYIEGVLRGEPQEFEREIPDPNGGPSRHSLANYIPDIVGGVVRGFFVLVTDVSALKRAELALRDSEERFRLTIDEAPIGMALVAPNGRFLRVNRRLCEIVGYAEEELVERTFQDITHPDDLDIDLAMASQLARGEIPRYQLSKRYIRKDGSIADIMLSGSVLRNPKGELLHFIAQIEDITEQKRLENELRFAEAKSSGILSISPDAIISADESQRITLFNEGAEKIFGYSKAEVLGAPIELLIPARLREIHHQLVEKFAAGGEVSRRIDEREFPIFGLRKSGEEFPADAAISKLDVGGKKLLTVSLRDITERRRLEAALQASHADLIRAQSIASVGSWRLNVRDNVLLWSDEEYKIFGVAAGTPMTYEKFLGCVHPDDRAYVDREWSAALRGEPYDIEHRIIAHGEIRWVREKADLAFDQNHSLVGGIGVSLDITDRKRREEELRRIQERLELALRGADLAMWDWNVASGGVIFNSRWAEMRGYRPEEIRGHADTWISGVHPEDWPRVKQALEEHFQGRSTDYEVEHRVRTKSGEWIWILDRGKVVARNERGEPVRMAGTELDITLRRRSEEALRLAEAKSSGILSISADAIISIDESQRITLFNEGAEKIFGYSKAEMVGAPLEVLLPERFRAAHHKHVERFAAGTATALKMGEQGKTLFGLRKSGEEFPADAAISKLDVGGKRLLTVSLRDITEQKRIEDEQRFLAEVGPVLAESLDYGETLTRIAELAVRSIADLCFIEIVGDDNELRRLKVASRDPSKAWLCELFMQIPPDRRRPQQVRSLLETGQSVLLQLPSEETLASLALNEEHLRAIRAAEIRSSVTVPMIVRGRLVGTIAFVSSTAARVYGPADVRMAEALAQRAALAIENARLYLEARRATQARDEILGIVAHDLRNPLNNILLQVSLLQRRGSGEDPRVQKPIAAIDRAVLRMDRLIQDLLDVTRIESNHLSLKRATIAAGQVAADSTESQRLLASSASVELRLDLAQGLPEIWADRDRLLQALENLVGNAIKFTKPGGHITVGAAPREGEVLFWVSDTGAGIAASDLPRLFDRFWQARPTEHRGAGLGLFIVKGIVEAHGGRLWVESTIGQGSTFFFTIPKGPRAE